MIIALLKIFLFLFLIGLAIFVLVFVLYHLSYRGKYNVINKDISNQYYIKDWGVYYVAWWNFFELWAYIVKGADLDSFEVLSYNHARDKNNAYYMWQILDNVSDVDTFVALNSYYAKDDKNVFIMGDVLSWVDAVSYELIDDNYAKDKNNIYYYWEILNWVDFNSFKVLKWNYGWYYSMDKSNIYFWKDKISEVKGELVTEFENDTEKLYLRIWDKLFNNWIYISDKLDVDSFEIVSRNYVKDKKDVFYINYDREYIALENSDPKTFELLNDETQYSWKDKNNVYIMWDILDWEDPSKYKINKYKPEYKFITLRLADNRIKIVEKEKVNFFNEAWIYRSYNWELYYVDQKIDWADIDSFEILSNNYSKDKNNVYYWGKKIKDADIKTFELLNNKDKYIEYAKDKKSVYYLDSKLKDADPKTFELIQDSGFWKDKKSVYYMALLIKDIKPSEFKYEQWMYAEEVSKWVWKLMKSEVWENWF